MMASALATAADDRGDAAATAAALEELLWIEPASTRGLAPETLTQRRAQTAQLARLRKELEGS